MTKQDVRRILLANQDILREHKVRSIALFGSYVRNEQTEESDIDLLVGFAGGATLFDFVELQDRLSELLGRKVTIVSLRALSKYIGPYILGEAETIAEGL